MKMRKLIFAIVALGLSFGARAADWYVSPSGSDGADGHSPATALRTLMKVETLLQPGDRVLLMDGEFTMDGREDQEALVTVYCSGTPDAWITWTAAPGAHPVIRPSGWAGFDIRGSYHLLEGLTIIGQNDRLSLKLALADAENATPNPLYNTNGIIVEGRNNAPDNKPHHITVRNCTVCKCAGGGITVLHTDYIIVEDCLVYDNCWYMRYAGSGITTNGNWAHDDLPGYHVIIRRNRVFNNKTMVPWNKTGKLSDGNGILLDVTDKQMYGLNNPEGDQTVSAPAANKPVDKNERPDWHYMALIENNVSAFNGGSGIHVFRTSDVEILNNTTYMNGSVVDYGELFSNASENIVIMNNVIVPRPGCKVNIDSRNRNVTWDYNIYPYGERPMSGPHDIVADPMILRPSTDISISDFRLDKKSPALNAGTLSRHSDEDLTGRRRPKGKAVDMGAYEQK